MVELIFVRHGQTDWNLERKLQGIIDIPLNGTGENEAIALEPKLNNNFLSIISSPLKRAYKTAQILNTNTDIKIIKDGRIVERDFGLLAGQKACFIDTISKDNPENRVESIKSMHTKIFSFLKDAESLTSGSHMVVTHGGVISTLLEVLSKGELNWENTPISNCSLTSIKFSGEWNINYYNQRKPIDDLVLC